MSAEPGLEIRDLSVSYEALSGTGRKAVLDHLSLRFFPGDYVVLLGANGSGKSTLLHAIAGTMPGDVAGEIVWNGRSISTMAPFRRARFLGRIDQDPLASGAAHLTLIEHCQLSGIVRGRYAVAWDHISVALRDSGTKLDPKQPLRTLSGGQRQLFLLLLATLSDPEILLLDEPTSALDSSYTQLVLRSIDAYASSKPRIVVLVTHDLDEAREHGNRLVILTPAGQIAADVSNGSKRQVSREDILGWMLPRERSSCS
jgi:putative ABC transport system ATP-binding protein